MAKWYHLGLDTSNARDHPRRRAARRVHAGVRRLPQVAAQRDRRRQPHRLRLQVRDELKRTWARETRLDRQEKKLEGTTPQLTGKYAPAR